MEKRRKTMSEEQRELNRWVMELANYLMAEKGIDDKTALRKAHLTRNLLRALGEGKVTFSASEWPYSHFVYWDLDRQGFRSFRAEDLEDYIKDRVTVLKTE